MRFFVFLLLLFILGCQEEVHEPVVRAVVLPVPISVGDSVVKNISFDVVPPVAKEEIITEKREDFSTDIPEPSVIENELTPNPSVEEQWHEDVLATQFAIGELGAATAWDCHAQEHYGGVDNPINRSGWYPLGFTPLENPFYIALPYTDIGSMGAHKQDIPWYDASKDRGDSYTFVKNRWVAVRRNGHTCYAQWEDCLACYDGSGCTHFDYVFGDDTPTFPGIDISPAMSDCLGMDAPDDLEFGHADGLVSWRFVDDVPSGPWKEIVTTSGVDWEDC